MRTTLLLAGLSGTALLARGMALEPATPALPPMTLRQPRRTDAPRGRMR